MPIYIICIDKTKLYFPSSDAQIKTENYQFLLFQIGHATNGGGKIVFIREALTVKHLYDLETKFSERMYLEMNVLRMGLERVLIAKRNWFNSFACRQPCCRNKNIFVFHQIKNLLNNITVNRF